MKDRTLYSLLAASVLALSVVPVGGAVFVLGFALGDSPCVMCWEQRIAMLILALIGLFVLRYGVRPKYIGLSVLVSGWGLFMALRHTALHAARDIGQGFSIEILGAHTYTWAAVVYFVAVAIVGVLLLTVEERAVWRVPPSGPLQSAATVVFLTVVAANIVQAFASTGPPPFLGQSDPVRFSFNPKHWVWSMEEWSYAPASWRGRWAIEKPDLGTANPDPNAGPLVDLPSVTVLNRRSLPFALRGTPTDLAYDERGDRFLITTQHGVYIVDGAFGRILRYTFVDPGFSVDLGRFAGAAFLDPTTVIALGENKSYVVLRENDRADANRNFRFFLDSFDKFDELSRSRLTTVRARMMYTMALAFDPAAASLYTISVPNAKNRRLVVSRFDRRDMTLSEEFVPALHADSGLKLRDKDRSLDELYVTATTFADGMLYALSAAHGTLLTIDPTTRSVGVARTIPGLARPTGIAMKGPTLYVICQDATVIAVDASPTREAVRSQGQASAVSR